MVTEALQHPPAASAAQHQQQDQRLLALAAVAAGGSTTPRLALVAMATTSSCFRDVTARMGTAKAPGDGGYRIRLIGLQQPNYAPGQVYTG